MSTNDYILESYRPTQFFNTLKVFGVISEEARLRLSYEGIKYLEMDPSHVAMINAFIPSDAFDNWYVKDDRTLSLNLKDLIKTVGKIAKGEGMAMSTPTGSNNLTWTSVKGDMRINKTVPLLSDPIDDEVPEPKIFFKAKARIITGALYEAIEECSKVSEHIKLSVSAEALTISAMGNLGTTLIEFKRGSDNLIDIKAEETSVTTYTTEYLKDVIKVMKGISDVVTIELTTDMPIKVDCELAKGTLIYYLAPCIGV